MRKSGFSVLFIFLVLVISTLPVFAHGGEDEAVDAPTLVRQGIAFIEGIEDTEMVMTKLGEAIEANGEQKLADTLKLQQAMVALESDRLEEAKVLMIEAIGGDPADLELTPGFQLGVINVVLLVLAVIFIIAGILLLNKKTIARSEMNE